MWDGLWIDVGGGSKGEGRKERPWECGRRVFGVVDGCVDIYGSLLLTSFGMIRVMILYRGSYLVLNYSHMVVECDVLNTAFLLGLVWGVLLVYKIVRAIDLPVVFSFLFYLALFFEFGGSMIYIYSFLSVVGYGVGGKVSRIVGVSVLFFFIDGYV